MVFNTTQGAISFDALRAAGAGNLAGKPLADGALPLDMSEGMPPLLSAANTDSLGERIQRAFPQAHVVKTLTPMLAGTMVDPTRLPSEHNVFLAGDDIAAKQTVLGLPRDLGWLDRGHARRPGPDRSRRLGRHPRPPRPGLNTGIPLHRERHTARRERTTVTVIGDGVP